MFNPLKSYSHPALRIHAEAWVVYNDWEILATKVQIISETAKFWSSECREKNNFYFL